MTDPKARTVSLGEAFRFWLKLGFISFGGPAGQIAIMHRELVDRRRWLGEERFANHQQHHQPINTITPGIKIIGVSSTPLQLQSA